MGIFGFGVLRDHFASVVPPATIAGTGYVVCFDVTPIAVYAIRHSVDENDFAELFRRRMDSCKEVRFMRDNPPYALRYTLDNRAPQAKRQTQIQRLLDARPIVTRLAAAATPAVAAVTRQCCDRLRIKDVVSRIREILLRDFVLTVNPKRRRGGWRRDLSVATRRCDDDEDDNASSKRCKIVGGKDGGGGQVTFAQANRIEFDYDEGEGEIKAINWLAKHKGRLRMIMARDNDVFVYILSKMLTKRKDDECDGGGGRGNDGWPELNSYLVYHEGSNNVLLCWNHLRAYYGTCWILLLWLGVCFGNDFTFGILDKSIATVSHYYPLLERHFIATNVAPSRRSDNGNDDIVSIEQFSSSTASGRNAIIVESLTMAFCKLQDIFRPSDRIVKRDVANASSSSSSLSDKSDDDYDDDDDDYVHLWIARQLWSFFYTLELPNEFTKHQRFRTCPTLRINVSFDKLFISNETFQRLRYVDFHRHIESIVRYGV